MMEKHEIDIVKNVNFLPYGLENSHEKNAFCLTYGGDCQKGAASEHRTTLVFVYLFLRVRVDQPKIFSQQEWEYC